MNKRMINEARRPADVQHGRHKFKGLHYDKNGNPVYTHPSRLEDPDGGTLSDNDLKSQGWKYSKKHGLHGQISDPTSLPESKNTDRKLIRLTESDLHKIVRESVQRILKEDNNRLIMHICAGLINGNIPSKVNMEEAWEGVFDMIVDMGNYGEISATCEGEMGDSQFHVVSADITWNGDSLEIDENDPECGTLNRCLELLAKGLSDI